MKFMNSFNRGKLNKLKCCKIQIPIPSVVLSKVAIKKKIGRLFYLSAYDIDFLPVTGLYRYQQMMGTGITSVRVGKIQAHGSSTKMD